MLSKEVDSLRHPSRDVTGRIYHFPTSGNNTSLKEQLSCPPQLYAEAKSVPWLWGRVMVQDRNKQEHFPRAKKWSKGFGITMTREGWKVLYLLITLTTCSTTIQNKKNMEILPQTPFQLFLPHSSTTTSQGSKWIRRGSLVMSTSKDEVQQNLVCALIPRC